MTILHHRGLNRDKRTDSDSPFAAHAIELFAYRAARELGSLAGVLGGLDALIFTAGIGYLLAGETDDITTKEQVFDAVKYLGTPASQVARLLVPGGHIGLFMGSHTLRTAWPKSARWIVDIR